MARLHPTRVRNRYAHSQAAQAQRQQGALARARRPRPLASINAPAAGSPPPSAPAPAAATPGAPLPWDARYEQTVGGINRDRDQTLAELNAQELAAKQDFGFDDPSDPFNKLKMLEKAFQERQRGNTTNLAARKQLYSGALQNAQNAAQGGFSQDRDALRRSYDDILAGIQSRRIGVQSAAEDSIGDADYDRIQAGLENRPDPDTLPAPGVAPKPKRAPNPADAYRREQARQSQRQQSAVARVRSRARGRRN